jgi:hypothetical protein
MVFDDYESAFLSVSDVSGQMVDFRLNCSRSDELMPIHSRICSRCYPKAVNRDTFYEFYSHIHIFTYSHIHIFTYSHIHSFNLDYPNVPLRHHSFQDAVRQ